MDWTDQARVQDFVQNPVQSGALDNAPFSGKPLTL
jgi:hypothetical protein